MPERVKVTYYARQHISLRPSGQEGLDFRSEEEGREEGGRK